MARVIDITDKLNFEENPRIVIMGREFSVNSDAKTMLLVMNAFGTETEAKAINTAINLLFGEAAMEEMCAIEKEGRKLNMADLGIIVSTAMDLITGGDGEGETQTHTTT